MVEPTKIPELIIANIAFSAAVPIGQAVNPNEVIKGAANDKVMKVISVFVSKASDLNTVNQNHIATGRKAENSTVIHGSEGIRKEYLNHNSINGEIHASAIKILLLSLKCHPLFSL